MASISFAINFNNELYEKIENEYESGNYSSAIKTAILYISEEIKERTELDLDGDKLVSKAFSLENPLIKINTLETQTDKDEQLGFMLMFQGMYKAIRNPRNHNLTIDSKEDCDCILIYLNYLLSIILRSKPKFDYLELLSRINDIYFNKRKQYSDEVIKNIPREKMLDVSLKLITDINNNNFENISYVVLSIMKQLDQKEKDIFINSCSTILSKTTDITVIKSFLIFLSDSWELVNKSSQMRIANLLLTSFSKFEFISETQTNKSGNYETVEYPDQNAELSVYLRYLPHKYSDDVPFPLIKNIIENKLLQGEQYADFILSNFYFYLLDNNESVYPAFESIFCSMLSNGSKEVYNFLINNNGEPIYSISSKLLKSIRSFESK